MITLNHCRAPNFDLLRRAILRQGPLERVPMLELFADDEVIAHLMDVTYQRPVSRSEKARWTALKIQFWEQLGYDAFWTGPDLPMTYELLSAQDTATLRRDQREWHGADVGILTTWADFERYPWPRAEDADFTQVEHAAQLLPPGMKILGKVSGALEPAMWLMGFTSFALALHDHPALVAAIFARLSEIHLPIAATLLDMDAVGGLFIGDDMGFKTGTMVSPDVLRKYVFPYHKKLAAMAHERDKIYVLHACGNLEAVMDDLIDDVQIDAKHSYEDVIMPVEQVKATYGDRLGIVGGVDVDLLCRGSEDDVRERVRGILAANMPGGGYALGTGNSVANYIPPQNFLAMVEEGHAWRPES